jgi:hypothetical protein
MGPAVNLSVYLALLVLAGVASVGAVVAAVKGRRGELARLRQKEGETRGLQ